MQSQAAPKWIVWLFLIPSILGFADAAFLSAERLQNVAPPCTIGSCQVVTLSEYSMIAGIPVAFFGAIFYLIVILLSIAYLTSKKDVFLKSVALLSLPSFAATLWFVYAQAFLLNAYCIYCLFSAGTSTVIFVTGLIFLTRKKTSV